MGAYARKCLVLLIFVRSCQIGAQEKDENEAELQKAREAVISNFDKLLNHKKSAGEEGPDAAYSTACLFLEHLEDALAESLAKARLKYKKEVRSALLERVLFPPDGPKQLVPDGGPVLQGYLDLAGRLSSEKITKAMLYCLDFRFQNGMGVGGINSMKLPSIEEFLEGEDPLKDYSFAEAVLQKNNETVMSGILAFVHEGGWDALTDIGRRNLALVWLRAASKQGNALELLEQRKSDWAGDVKVHEKWLEQLTKLLRQARNCQIIFESKLDLGAFTHDFKQARAWEGVAEAAALKAIADGGYSGMTKEQQENFIQIWLALHDGADAAKPIKEAKAGLSDDDKEKKATAEKNLDDFIEALKKVKP